MVNTPRAQASLRDLKSAALPQEHVGHWHANIGIGDLAMTVRSVIVAEYGEQPLHLYPRSIHGDENHGLLPVLRGGTVCLADENGDLAVGIAGAGRPPLMAVDHVYLAVADNAGLNVGSVGGGDIRLCHGKTRPDFARKQRFQPAFLLLRSAIARQYLHV